MDIEMLLDKWTDVVECAEDLSERTVAQEIVDDLKEVLRERRGLIA